MGEPLAVERVADLGEGDRDALRALSAAVYPPDEVADWPGRALEWAAPEWCVRVHGDDRTLASYVGLWLRHASHDGRPVLVGGIGGVKTHPVARRRGLATQGLRCATEFFRERRVDFGLLVCAPRLLPYYGALGWREFAGRLLVQQRGASVEFTLNRVMTLAVTGEAPTAGTIDLAGPPW